MLKIASLDVDWVLELMNSALECDREAITKLVENRVPCDEALSNHYSIQVSDGKVGLLGILNGLCGVDEETGYGPICAIYDKNNEFIVSFARTDFEKIKRWKEMN